MQYQFANSMVPGGPFSSKETIHVEATSVLFVHRIDHWHPSYAGLAIEKKRPFLRHRPPGSLAQPDPSVKKID